jgi:hypothetical protein
LLGFVFGWSVASGLFAAAWARIGWVRHRQLQAQVDALEESARGDGR